MCSVSSPSCLMRLPSVTRCSFPSCPTCRATPDQQLGPHAAERLATEAEVKREYERVMAAAVAAGETINLKEAEARAVERVAAAHRAAEAAEARAAQSQPGS